MLRVERQIHGAHIVGVGCAGENLLPVRAAIGGAIDAAFVVGFVGMAESGDIHAIWVGGIDDDFADLAGRCETDRMPGLAGIGGFEKANAIRVLAANVGLAGAGEDDVRIRGRNGDGADGADGDAGGRIVGDGHPGAAGVLCLPNASAHRAHVEGVGLRRVAADGVGAPAAHGAHIAPLESGEQAGGILLTGKRNCEGGERRHGKHGHGKTRHGKTGHGKTGHGETAAGGGHRQAPMRAGFLL